MEQDELREWEHKCIQEEAPECAAACPIHVDGRLFLKEMARGDWEAGYKVLAKTMPFPGILGRICDHPCELACKRGAVEEPIAIGLLEKKCIENASGKVKLQLLSRRQQRIAVLGSGFAGLCAAWDLLKKGFRVTVFESADRLAGHLRSYPESELSPEVIEAELAALETMKGEIQLNAVITADLLEAFCSDFDAIFIDREAASGWNLPLADGNGWVAADAETGATARSGVFAGGGTLLAGCYSPVNEALQGRKGALSIERFVQDVQLGTGREKEGPYATRLFTSIAWIDPQPRVVPQEAAAGFSDEEAQSEAARCIQCECMECVKVCLYLERYQGYPKKYARQVFNNERVIFGAAHTKNQFVNSCSNCGLCKTVCPNNFFMGDLCRQARRTLNEQKLMPASFHEFALKDMAHSSGESFSLARHQPGRDASAWAYFPSCQLCASSPREVLSSYRHLRQQLSGGVGIMLGCCGAPAYWSGRDDLFQQTLEKLRGQWESLGRPKVVTACSTCQSIFGDHLPEMQSISIWTVLEEHGLPALQGCGCPDGMTVAVADPCMSRHQPEIRASVRRIVQSLGLNIHELSLSGDKPECCGYGGLIFNANQKLAEEIVEHRTKAQQIADPAQAAKPAAPPPGWYRTSRIEGSDTMYYNTEVSGHDYVAYCAMCRDRLATTGKRASHLIELVFPSVEGGDPAGRGWISWSERRSNRGRVKDAILRERGELEGTVEAAAEIALVMTDEVRRKIDSRRILEDDIRTVIEEADRTGRLLKNEATGRYLAYQKTDNVTFWVEYVPGDDGFIVHSAYCHRMNIVGVKQ